MEQKPIKRNPNIQSLSRDHHFTLLFCWKIRQGIKRNVDTERIKKYVQYFWTADMQEHFREEEEILFAPVSDDKVERALDEHKDIAARVNDISLSSNPSTTQLASLADLVDAHVRYEERELFPHLEQILSGEQLEKIGLALAKEEQHQDDYPDQFWT